LSGVVYAIGYIISSQFTDNLGMMYVGYGVLGAGVGIGYSCALSCCVKWFPDKRGLVSGLAVAGFGAGTFIFAQVGQYIIDNGSTESVGLSNAYLYLGFIFLAMVLGGSQLLCDPPTGFCPSGWSPPKSGAGSTAKKQFMPKEMVRTKSFYLLWIMFALSATCGLMMIGNVGNAGKSLTANATVVAENATIVGILAIFNGTGRIVWGLVSDKLGRTTAMKIMFLTQAIILFGAAGFMVSDPASKTTAFIGFTAFVSMVGFCFGGNFALFPPTTSEYFGTKFFGNNYGLVFTSYAVGGVVGGLMPGIVKGGFEWVFIATAVGSLVAFGVAWLAKPPISEEEPARA
jgi:OFA family oxalate/formate antiporter-like MFS transporter